MVLMIAFWVLFIAGIAWLVLGLGGPQALLGSGPATAREILEARFARGEIEADEFRTKRAAIEAAE